MHEACKTAAQLTYLTLLSRGIKTSPWVCHLDAESAFGTARTAAAFPSLFRMLLMLRLRQIPW